MALPLRVNLPRSALENRASAPLAFISRAICRKSWHGASCRRATSSSPWPRPLHPLWCNALIACIFAIVPVRHVGLPPIL